MGGIELRKDELIVSREPNELDELAIAFTAILDELGIEHVYVAGYVAVLTGRPRTTQDIDVLLERIDEAQADHLVERLAADGMWGPAMPLDHLYEMLSRGDDIWVAPAEQVIPHIEAKFVSDEADAEAIDHPVTARIAGEAVPIGPMELQIADKLYLGSPQDFEDAVHLYALFEESLRGAELERWVGKLGVDPELERLRAA